ncbi:hypothetical protein GCM10009734_81310 [Nonomuraea bangladeshensis]
MTDHADAATEAFIDGVIAVRVEGTSSTSRSGASIKSRSISRAPCGYFVDHVLVWFATLVDQTERLYKVDH